MELHQELVKSVDEKVVERLKGALDDCIKTMSRNTHSLLKLLRRVIDVCTPQTEHRAPSLGQIIGQHRLDRWLGHFDTLSLKVRTAFSEITYHMQELLDIDSRDRLRQSWSRHDQRSMMEQLETESPFLREEMAFLLAFLDHVPLPQHLPGIVESHKRPDGGYHITSTSTSTKHHAQKTVYSPPGVPHSISTVAEKPFKVEIKQLDVGNFHGDNPGQYAGVQITCLDSRNKELYMGTMGGRILRVDIDDTPTIKAAKTVYGMLLC